MTDPEPVAPTGAPPLLAIVADDLTGAADAAAVFGGRGLPTVVDLRPIESHFPLPPLADGEDEGPAVVARSTGGRDATEAEAVAGVRAAVAAIRGGGEPRLWYLKIDSLLRGHPGAELAAAMAALGLDLALVCPAVPGQGRTVEGGRIRLTPGRRGGPGGVLPLAELDVAAALRPAAAAPIAALGSADLAAGPAPAAARLLAMGPAVVVADAESDKDLDRLALAALAARPMLTCGAAGLAAAVARRLAWGSAASPRPPAAAGPVLVVAGSHHPATARQVVRLAEAGACVVRPARLVDAGAGDGDALAADLAAALGAGRTAVLTACGCPEVRLGGAAIAAELARIAARPEVLGRAAGLVATGGEVAAAVFAAAGATALRLGGEVRPAIPWGVLTGGQVGGLPVVTKAGSFGDEETLMAAVAFLHGRAG